MTEREQFESALSTKPEARYWNTTDAMYWAWQAARAAQPAQAGAEPVAWWNGKETAWFEHELNGCPPPADATIPLYTHPPARVPLTVGELNDLLDGLSLLDPFAIARAVEAAHGIGGGK